MKICIVTVYNSLNSGSFLQAYALMKILENNGHKVVFLKTGVRKPNQVMLGTILGSIILFQFAKAIFNYNKWRGFVKTREVFQTIPNRTEDISTCDLFVFGSDEIWNVSRKSFSKYPIFWGQGIDSENIIAYAPSINRSTLDQIRDLKYPQTCLEKFKRIMVRDEHTKDVLSHLTPKEITTVIDPTLLLESKEYETVSPKIPKDDYVLVYAYGTHKNKCQIDNIKHFAKMKNLKIVSINDWFDWCDINIAVTPFEFIAFVKNAKYVMSETFHGTVFSILFSRQFVAYAGDNVKVLELLNLLGLQSRNVERESELEVIMDSVIDYERVNKALECSREKSVTQLFSAIAAIKSV